MASEMASREQPELKRKKKMMIMIMIKYKKKATAIQVPDTGQPCILRLEAKKMRQAKKKKRPDRTGRAEKRTKSVSRS